MKKRKKKKGEIILLLNKLRSTGRQDYVKSSFVFFVYFHFLPSLSLASFFPYEERATRYITDVTAIREDHQMTIGWIVLAQHRLPTFQNGVQQIRSPSRIRNRVA